MRPSPVPRRPLALLSLLSLLAAAVISCGSEDQELEPLEPISQAIVGGAAATACQWPTTVALRGCTATLVHPSIITTAGHCGINHPMAYFGESRTKAARAVPIEYCRRVAGGDVAFCKLTTPVTDLPITPVLMGCETDILKPGQKVAAAGFGRTTARGVAGGMVGVKFWVELQVHSINSSGKVVTIYAPNKGLCFGDSGGPAFVRLADGSWRAFGILSSGASLPGKQCENGDRLSLIHKFVGLIEQESKLDITPCHDADGTWNPSAACRGFSLTPEMAGRSWETGCAEPTTSALGATCGAAFAGALPPPAAPPAVGPPGVADAGAADAGGGGATKDGAAPEPSAGDAAAGKPEPTPTGNPPPTAPPVGGGSSAGEEPKIAGEGCSCTLGGAASAPSASAPAALLLLMVGIGVVRRRGRRGR